MADKDLLDNVIGGRQTSLKSGQTINPANHTIMQNLSTMRTYLLANGYTAAQFAAMTPNDVKYATRIKLGLSPA